MKYPCGMIRDLLPLYHDGVCSGESREAVESHLAECESCRAFLAAIGQPAERPLEGVEAAEERRAAGSFRQVKRHFRLRQLMAAGIAVAALALAGFGGSAALQQAEKPVIAEDDNLSVAMVDGSLVGKLRGSEPVRVQIKRVEAGEETWLFYNLTDTRWNDLVNGDGVYSEYLLCPADKGAGDIDRVYYYGGDYTGLESLPEAELEAVAQQSLLLWSREGN